MQEEEVKAGGNSGGGTGVDGGGSGGATLVALSERGDMVSIVGCPCSRCAAGKEAVARTTHTEQRSLCAGSARWAANYLSIDWVVLACRLQASYPASGFGSGGCGHKPSGCAFRSLAGAVSDAGSSSGRAKQRRQGLTANGLSRLPARRRPLLAPSRGQRMMRSPLDGFEAPSIDLFGVREW